MTTEARQVESTLAYRTMRVATVQRITPGTVRITFVGDDLRELPQAAPDGYLKLFVPQPGQYRPQLPPPLADATLSWYREYLAMPDDIRPAMRTYTVRAHRPEAAELDIDFVLHADSGPASSWAATAGPGDEVAMLGPHGLYEVPDGTDWQLLIGDESAVPAIAAILEALPVDQQAQVYIEVGEPAEEQSLKCAGRAAIHWVQRGDGAVGERLLETVRAATLPDGRPYAWIAGEAGTVKFARRHLVRERGVDKAAITFTGYWRRGKSEEDTGRENLRQLDAGEQLTDDLT